MKGKDLIVELQKLDEKKLEQEVWFWVDGTPIIIEAVDDTVTDRIDLMSTPNWD